MTIGFFYVSILTLISIAGMLDWIFRLNAPTWVNIILGIGAFFLWISGLIFLRKAEIEVFTKKNKHKDD